MNRAHISHEGASGHEWLDLLDEEGVECVVLSRESDIDAMPSDSLPHVVFLDLTALSRSDAKRCAERCSKLKLPTIALVSEGQLGGIDLTLGFEDFIVTPPSPTEALARVKHVLWRTRSDDDENIIRVGDLVINPSTYEITLRGRRVNLRFKEYELLRLLVANPGRVYTRDALLSSIWGYDYFGGTRTVDVHIRRLRSKIEDADHSYIETIWNVGYRFRDPAG